MRTALANVDSTRARGRAEHLGISLVIMGLLVLFFAFLVRAEHRELGRSLAMEVSSNVEAPVGVVSQREAAEGFGRALLAAELGMLLTALALFLERRELWSVAVGLALVCTATSSLTFAAARTKMRAAEVRFAAPALQSTTR